MKCLFICAKASLKFLLISGVLLSLLSSKCIAAEIGIGISLESRDQIIYLPINITNNFRTELSFRYASSENETSSYTSEDDNLEIGIGLYAIKKLYEKTQLFYGCNFLYYDSGYESSYTSPPSSSSGDYTSYTIAPTLGIEYFVTDHISLGGKAEFYYADAEVEYSSNPSSNSDRTFMGTNTNLAFRYYF